MSNSTVYAVMTATVEVMLRPSNGSETFDEMLVVATSEAKTILQNIGDKYSQNIRFVGEPILKHVLVKGKQQ